MTENHIQDELTQESGDHQIEGNPLAKKYRFSRYLILGLLIVGVLLGFSELDPIVTFAVRVSIAFLLFVVGARIYKKEILPLAYLNIYGIIMCCIYEGSSFAGAEYWHWVWMIGSVLDAVINILVYKHIARCGVPYTVVLYFAVLIMYFLDVMFIPQVLINDYVSEVYFYLYRLFPIVIVFFTWLMLRSDMVYKPKAEFKLGMPVLYISFRDVCITIISILLVGGLGWLALMYGAAIPSII